LSSVRPVPTANVLTVVWTQLAVSDQPRAPVVYLPTERTGYISPVLATADYGVGIPPTVRV